MCDAHDPKEERREKGRIAVENAKGLLKIGDVIHATRGCYCQVRRYTITAFSWPWICSRIADDIHPLRITKVNGQPVDFTQLPQA